MTDIYTYQIYDIVYYVFATYFTDIGGGLRRIHYICTCHSVNFKYYFLMLCYSVEKSLFIHHVACLNEPNNIEIDANVYIYMNYE